MIDQETTSREIRRPKIYSLLYPLSLLYGLGVRCRNWLFDCGLLKSKEFDLPVICVGNISVGGTGKTPHTEYLVELLKESYRVAVLSRGYKRKSKGFVCAQQGKTTISDIGDEPFQMWTKYPDITVAVDADRCEGITRLTENIKPPVEVVVLDDAFQHRYVKADINIVLINYYRPVFMDKLLPAGRLREPAKGQHRADILIVTKCPADLTLEESRQLENGIAPLPNQSLFFTTLAYGDLYALTNRKKVRKLSTLSKESEILLLTGIASPTAIIEELSTYTDRIHPLTFSDHHQFEEKDFKLIREEYEKLTKGHRIIITTEKDAARLGTDSRLEDDLRQNCFVLPIKVEFLNNNEELFNNKILDYVRKNTRNSLLSKG